MMYAVTIEPLNAIFFLADRPDESSWPVEEDVSIDIPSNFAYRTGDEAEPQHVLCAAVTDPKQYKLFRYEKEVDPGEYRPTGRQFGGVFSKPTWQRFLKQVPATLAFLKIPDTERPGATEEAVAAVKQKR